MIKKVITSGIIFLCIISSITVVTFNKKVDASQNESAIRYPLHSVYDCYHLSDTIPFSSSVYAEEKTYDTQVTNVVSQTGGGGLMNSSWPMYCHDVCHTGRSPHGTEDNHGAELWRFKQPIDDFIRGSPIVGDDGTIYFGGSDFYALYPNGSFKWSYDVYGAVRSCPAMGDDGTIYIGTTGGGDFLYAIYPNGTLKWKYGTEDLYSSPAIGDDGTIYFGDANQYINALYPNGTMKWRYKTDNVVYSSPAIGADGTIYCGSHDTYLYALYSNNGTLKWRFKTGDWIRVSPCIADDGTIYIVSLDNCLYAIYPNGTMKWKTNVGAGTSPTIGQDGTIYCGYSNLYAINPTNGSVRWVFNPGPERTIRGATPCSSADGTIYFGTHIGDYGGGEIIAVNPNGTEQWRRLIANQYVDSAPAISEDGTVYIGTAWDENGYSRGYLYAFGQGPLEVDANGPYNGVSDQPIQFNGSVYGGIPPYSYHWDFGDENTSTERNPTHAYTKIGNYTAIFAVSDSEGNSSNDTTTVSILYPSLKAVITKPEKALYIMNFKVRPYYVNRNPLIIGPIDIDVQVTSDGINRVEFYIDNKLKATDTTEPYSWMWINPAFLTHTINVVAYDTFGQNASAEITVSKFF